MAPRRTRAALLAGAALSLATAPPALAQEATPQADAAAAAAPAEGEIVVTGSRIARPALEAANPITSYNSANIAQSGNTNVTDFLQRVPALTGSLDRTQSAGYDSIARQPFGGAGVNELNLRNLGTNRTLVLVNGRRHVAGEPSTAAVDISAIPTDLIEQVDVLTGGASAVYGADGVSGVVNFILRRDFEGLAARAQNGVSQYGDGGNRFASVIAGRNFADERANLTLAYEYSAEDRVETTDRKFLTNGRRRYLVSNPADPDDDPRLPDNVLFTDLRYAGESPYGAVDIDGDGVADFRGDGQRYNPGTLVSYYAIGGDSTEAANYTGDLLPQIERHAVNLLTHYDLSDAFKISLEGKFVQVRATTFSAYTGNYPATLFVDNAYIPLSIRNAALAAGQTSFTSVRDNFDLGRRGERDRRRTYRGVIGVTGRISDHATYDAAFVYGRTDVAITKLNDRLGDRFTAALDAVIDPRTGQATCRSNISAAAAAALGATTFTPGPNSGCVPLNTFGLAVADPASIAFFRANYTSPARITQTVGTVSLSGDFGQFFELPGGPVQFAVGGEYRRETSRFDPNPLLANNQLYQYDEPGGVQGVRGAFDVYEAFGELNVPILADLPFAHTLSVGAAGRYSDYSTIGGTGTYQFNAIYAPVRDISFRGSYGESVRAPNIGELFTPTAASTNFINDPCDLSLRNNGSQFRAANCSALLTSLGVNPATYAPVSQAGAGNDGDGTTFGSFRGNPDLQEETARTWTAGVALRPRFVPGLTISADWYDIRLRGAVSTPQAQTVAELCVDQPTLSNVFCQSQTRRQGSGRVISYIVQPQNVSQFRTAGLDIDIDWLIRAGSAGTFDLRLVGGYLDRLDIVATPGADVEDQVDQAAPNRPRWNFAFTPSWTRGDVTLAYTLRWFDRLRRFPRATTDGDPDYAPAALLRYREAWLSDVQAQWALADRFAFYGGINNLTDEKPDDDGYDVPAPSLGRYFYVGAKLRFNR